MLASSADERQRAARIEALVGELAAFPDADLRARAEELVQALLGLYGDALARVLEIAVDDEAGDVRLVEALARDELVGSLLLLHGLHPHDLDTRLARALDELMPYLRAHGAEVELLGVAGGVARLRLRLGGDAGRTAPTTLRRAVEEAVAKAAPDLEGLEIEGAEPAPQLITLSPNPRRQAKPSTTG